MDGPLFMESERVRKSVRNDINRKINAEIANQAKSAASAVDPLESTSRALEPAIVG